MKLKSSLYSTIAALAFVGTTAFAAPVQVGISGVSFTLGNGYGIDASEASTLATLLDVRFDTSSFAAQNFTLNNVGDSQQFTMANVRFLESNNLGGIAANETDNLGVTAALTFTNPVGSLFTVMTTGIATTGSIQDGPIDLSYTWAPVNLEFGNGGLLEIALQGTSFTTNNSPSNVRSQQVIVTYKSASVTNEVPEPASLALVGLGLAGLGLARRRRR